MNPIVTFLIPCYNSSAYMDKCISSIVDVAESDPSLPYPAEIIIVDDGSDDGGRTLAHAKKWEERHPEWIHAVHQENGGPGEAINTGLALAKGTYFKVVDSDDWLDKDALRQVFSALGRVLSGDRRLDMLVCNYVYEYTDGKEPKPVRYTHEFPVGKIFDWDGMRHSFPAWKYMMMHSVIVRTDILHRIGLHLPAHTFYVDEIFLYMSLINANTLLYLDVDLYRYLIGRPDQSVNESIMASRCDQQVKVTKIKIDSVDVGDIQSKNLRKYLTRDITITMCLCTVFTTLSDRDDRLELRDGIWSHLREQDPELWRRVRWSFIGLWCNLRSPIGVYAFTRGYRAVRKFFQFN